MQTILTSPTLAWLTCKFVPTHKTYLDTVNGMTVVIYKHGCQTSIATTLERHRCALPRLHGAECFQADFRRRSKWRHEFALCAAAQGEFAYCKWDQECKILASGS